ncbi:MAG: vWA domain-containing protein, partial [Polyangiaceae bacterium]
MALALRRTAAAVVVGLSAAALAPSACSSPEPLGTPQPATTSSGGGAGGDLFTTETDAGPPPLDASGLCGNQLHQIISDAPNVYFVIDASGSMSAPAAPGTSTTRAERVRKAVLTLVKDLGALINVGAAVFPADATEDDACLPGEQVMAVTPGDVEGTSTTFNKIKNAIDVVPFGGTPTSATLDLLRPGIGALSGRTVVLLVTDGGPNCNFDAVCDGDGCLANIEGCSGASCCNPGGNCCA